MAEQTMATHATPTTFVAEDVTHPDLYINDGWHAPFAALRAHSPVHYHAEGRFGPYWSVSTYKPIQHIEALPKIFSSDWELGGITVAGEPMRLEEGEVRMPMFIAMDPPKHSAQRRTVAPAFGPTEIDRMRAEMRTRTAKVLESLPVGSAFDWVQQVSIELTTGSLARLFDFPWDDRHKLTHWSDVLGDIELFDTTENRQYRLQEAYAMGMAFHQLWNSKKPHAHDPDGGHDLISMMLRSDAMAHMDDAEFMGNLILLIVGGNDTTRNSMTAFAHGLSQFPDARATLEANPALIPNAVQELIRWQTPLAHMRRTALEDAQVDGHIIRKHDKVVLWYLSANRDESVFPDADRIIVDRDNARRHLSFGYGIHRCVGARVAELQLTILLEEMARLRLRAHAVSAPERVGACFVHGYKSQLVELERY